MGRAAGGKVQEITRTDAIRRAKTGRLYLHAAELIIDEPADESPTVATGNAVLAGIAAADAITGVANGTRWRGADHTKAADHVERATGDAKLAGKLRALVNLKDQGHYGMANVSRTDAKKALRLANQLCDEADQRINPALRARPR